MTLAEGFEFKDEAVTFTNRKVGYVALAPGARLWIQVDTTQDQAPTAGPAAAGGAGPPRPPGLTQVKGVPIEGRCCNKGVQVYSSRCCQSGV